MIFLKDKEVVTFIKLPGVVVYRCVLKSSWIMSICERERESFLHITVFLKAILQYG